MDGVCTRDRDQVALSGCTVHCHSNARTSLEEKTGHVS